MLVRYLAQDDPAQSARAMRLIEEELSERNPGFVSVVAMVESVWVLGHAHGLSDRQVAAIIERLLQTDVLVVENEQEVFAAMIALRQGATSFADALVAALGKRAGCSDTVTFDQKASRIAGFQSL